jgi:hypothetical protein
VCNKGLTSQDFCQGPGDRYPVATHVHGGLSQAFPSDTGVSIPKIDIQQTVNLVKKSKGKVTIPRFFPKMGPFYAPYFKKLA